jgi:hypothetical protein
MPALAHYRSNLLTAYVFRVIANQVGKNLASLMGRNYAMLHGQGGGAAAFEQLIRAAPGDWGINQGQLRISRTLAELRRLRLVKGLNFRHRRDSSARHATITR